MLTSSILRFSKSTKTRYFTDPGTYPIFATMAVAASLPIIVGFRKIFYSPDVTLTSETKRNTAEVGHKQNAEQLAKGVAWAKMENGFLSALGSLNSFAGLAFPTCSNWRPNLHNELGYSRIADLQDAAKANIGSAAKPHDSTPAKKGH